MRRTRALAVLALAAACGPKEDVTPQVPVQAGAAARAMALTGRFGVGGPFRSAKSEVDAGAEPAEPAPGRLAFSCVEPRGPYRALARVPCEVTIVGRGADAGADVLDVEDVENGRVAMELAPGAYRVTVGRGPEFAVAAWDADVVEGKTTWAPNEGAVVVAHVVDTRGYLAVDGAAREEREALARDAAQGIEVVVGDVARTVQQTKLEDALAVVAPIAGLDAVDPLTGAAALLANAATGRPARALGSFPARTYVRVAPDASPATWSPDDEADVVRGLRDRGDAVVTTGPFVRVTANGVPLGGIAKPRADREVEVAVHVECAPWMAVDRATLTRASGGAPLSQTFALRPTAMGGLAADITFYLRASTDDAFVVTIDAAAADAGAPPLAEGAPPRAVTAPLWIDADGDGASLGRTAPPPLETRDAAGARGSLSPPGVSPPGPSH